MNKTVVYYEFEPVLGVNSTHDDCDSVRHYNYFSSLMMFNQWIRFEMNNCKTVEITDSNYSELKEQGLIS